MASIITNAFLTDDIGSSFGVDDRDIISLPITFSKSCQTSIAVNFTINLFVNLFTYVLTLKQTSDIINYEIRGNYHAKFN